jgi:predicted metalloprotease
MPRRAFEWGSPWVWRWRLVVVRSVLDRWRPIGGRAWALGLVPLLLLGGVARAKVVRARLLPAKVAAPELAQPAVAVPAAAGLEGAELQQLREQGGGADLRRRYLLAAHELLYRYWLREAEKQGKALDKPQLLFAGDQAQGCGVNRIEHPMAFYCPTSLQIAMALDLRRATKAARGKSDQELLPMELAVLAHEWGHHVNRSLGQGPYRTGFSLTAQQEELAADWRTGILLGWLLSQGTLAIDDFTTTANLMFELGDYERISLQHHGYPKDRFTALTEGLATQLKPGQRMGEWTVDTRESFSRPMAGAPLSYDVRRFEIDRSGQIGSNVFGVVLGAASCIWGDRQQCLGAALDQGKGRAYGTYTHRTLVLHCGDRSFDVINDNFDRQPLARDGKGQAAVLADRDCR